MIESRSKRLQTILIALARLFWVPFLIVMVQSLRIAVFPLWYQLDKVAHFFGGFSIAVATGTLYAILRTRRILPVPLHLSLFGYLLITTVALVGVLWEFMEYLFLQDIFIRMKIDLYSDTISDLALDLLGACAYVAMVGYRKKI